MTNVDKSGGQPIVQQTQAKQKIKRTKEQIGKVVHTIMQLVPNDAATKTKIARIAQELYDYADTHNGAVGKSEFTKLLKEITPENVVGVIMKYNNEVSPDESIVEMMLDEVASSHDDIREALLGQGDGKNQLRGLFTVLLDRAKAVGMDDATIKSYRKQFETQLNKELGRAAFLRSSAKMDEIINTVIQSIRNHIEENNKAAKANGSQKTVPAKAHETKATNTIVARYNKALKDFNNQLKADGWAEDIADAMGRLWGKNYADAVRKDLKIAKEQVNRLKAALTKGDEAFRAEFLNIFGVAYDPANITAYQNAENAYTTALKAKSNEDSFNQAFNVLLKKGELKAEYETLTYPDTGVRTTATKEQVYQREFKKVAELFDATVKSDKSGQFALLGVTDGKSYVEKAIESAGAKDKSIDEKFKVLQNIAGKISQSLAQETKKACGGRSFASIQQQYENCYKAAYGLENDILKRVTDYNISQQKGGGAVKGAAVAIAAIGIGMLTAGGGTAAIAGGTGAATTAGATGGTVVAGALKGAATVSALTALTELSNKLSSKNGLRPEDIGQIAQASLVSGTMCLMFAGQSYAITNLTLKAATAAGMGAEAAGYTAAALSTAGFVGTGLGTEYVFQGEISVEGATFTVIMALVSGVMQVKQVYQNARAAEAQIREKTMQDIANARKQLGFADDEVINLDKAEKAYKEIAKLHHPNSAARTGDGAMHDAIFAAAQNAIEVLRKNAMSINATVTQQVTNPQPAQPSQPKANPSHIPTAEDGAIVPISHYQTQQTTNVGVYPITANGVNLNKTITNANNAVVTSETEIVGESTITNGKDANGNIVRTTLDNGVIKSVQYMDGNNTVSQIMVNDELVAHYIVNANGKGVYTDATGQVITESHYNRLVSDAVNGQTDPVNMPLTPAQNNGATVVELNPQVSAVAASSSGPVANPSAVPSQVTGGAAPTENVYEPVLDNGVGRSNTEIRATYEAVEDVGTLIKEYNFHKQAGGQELKLTILEDVINQRMTNIAEQARASVVTTDNSELNGMQVTTSKDANGTPVVTTTSTQLHNNKVVAQNVYNSNGISVSETTVDGKVIGSYITTGGEDGVYIDHYGYIITESQFNDAVSTAVAKPAPSTSPAPAVDAKTQAAVDAIADFKARYDAGAFPNPYQNTLTTQEEILEFIKPLEGSEHVQSTVASIKEKCANGNIAAAAKSAKIAYGIDAVHKYAELLSMGKTAEANAVLKDALQKSGEDLLHEASMQARYEIERKYTPKLAREVSYDVLVETGKEPRITVPDGMTVDAAKARIAELQQKLKNYGTGLGKNDDIKMDRIQREIRVLREIAPLDRTNLQEVLQASPDEVFLPVKADNIKGQGISFKPYVPEDPKALAKVTYRAVPLYTEARTVEEMIRIAARDGVKIEMVQDADGNYYPGVKSVWSEGGYFKLDRNSYVVQYGEIPADDPYIDQAWAQQNKYTNADGKEVVMDCAIVAADKKTAADIMPHSYVKANGAQLSPSDKHNWGGFQAHKDPDGVVNAVAYDEPKELQTLEGKITTDVTMGDVEGNVYNKYNDLKKQILRDKLVANPDDPNSQKFIDLVKAGKDDEAIALLREATKASQAPEPAPADAKKPYVKPEITEASATPQTEVLASSPRTSSDYLSTSNRLLHPKNYALAKQLSDAGLNVEIYSGGSFNVSIPFHPSRMQGVSLRESTYELDGSIGRESNNIELRATINPEQSAITVSGNVEDFYMYESEHALANDILDALVDKFTVNGKTDIRTGLDEFLDTTLATAKQVDSFALENIKDRVLNQLWQQDNFFNMSEAEITDSVLYFTMNDNLTERDVASIVQAAQNRQDEMLIDSMEVEAVAEDGVVTVVPDDEVTATPVSDAYAKLLDKPLSVTLPDNSEIVRTEISEDKFKISHRPSGGFIGNAMENGKPVVVDGNAGFRLAGTVELNLSEPSIKAVLDGLLPGEEISVGRNGMIKIKNAPSSVSREHLTIKKLADNSYEVTDKSKFGTEIQLEQAPTEPKKPYVKPEMTQTSVKPEGEVMASSPRTSSSYLDFTDRIMHRTEYKLAKQLQEQGMEVKFGVDGKYSIEIDASQFDGLELLDGNYYHELYDGYTVFEYSYKDGKLVITGQKAGGFASDAERMQFALDMRTKGASYSNQYATGGKTVNTRSINEIIQSNIDKAKHSSQVLKDNGVTVTKFNHGDAARYKGDTYAPAEIRFTQNGKEYVGEYRGNNVEIIPKSDLEGMLADAIEGKSTDKFAIKEFDHATGKYKPVENISQTFAENKPRELKLPSVSGSTQADIVEGWRDFVRESKAVINSATSIDELRTLRNQIKNVENKQAAQELREAYVLKEQALREALPESTKSIENMYRPTDLNQSTSSVSSSSVYQQLQKEPLILPGEDNRTRVYSPAARSEVIHTPTTGFKDKRLQIAKHYVVDSQAHFRLDGWFELQLNSPEIKNILDGLNPGEEITVGKQGHIKNENLYTKKHLTIKKLSDNQFEITPLGICGTEISTETTVTDAKAKISGTNNKKSYEKPQTTVMSYSMESDLMASDVQTTKYNSNQERILAEAGFSDGVIDDIIANGPWGNPKVDAALVEEVKNMVIWMEGEIANGATVNRTLIETAINTFSPGASGGSAACQRSILANYWNRGTEVYNAYGQKAPDQSTFSWGNLKAKWNKVKNSVKEFYDYKKWELTGKDSGVPRANTEQFSEWSTEKLMDEFNARFNYGIKDGTTELRAVLTERGYVPNENGYYLTEQITPEDVAAHPGQVTGGSAPAAEGWAEESLNTQLAFGKVGTALQEGLSQLVVKSDVPQAAQDVHAKIVNGNFGAFGSKSASQVGAELKAYAEQNGLKFIERGSEFELQDANGNVVREAHEGFFDGQWYDHHQTFNADNKITNRFVVDHNGKLQSTVEYFYDENGNQTMSVGYGGKSGTDIMVFEGSNRSQLTIQQFIEKYGFEPTFYREINPNVEFKSPIKNPVPVSSVQEMEQIIADDYKADTAAGNKAAIALGESLTNPSFPTEFNETTFKAWADANGLTLSIEKGIALFRDADGNVVRRITNDYNHSGQVYDDHVVLYENGKEVAKFIKYTDEANIKYYYNYSETQGRYTGKAELRPDGSWYDLNTGIKLDKSPVTARPNTVSSSAKPSNNIPSTPVPTPKEAIFDFDYSSEWNPSKLQAWADKNGLTLNYIDNNRIAVFKDSNGHVVRRVTQDWSDKTKVYDDKRAIYDKDGNLIGQLDKYMDEAEPEYSFKQPGQTQKTYAKLGSDGLWYENKFVDGRFEKEILPTNPITGMPQVTGVNPEAKVELQVHEVKPAPASFENAGVPETTLSASYVENLRASDSSSKFMSNIDNITKSALGEGRIRQSFYDKVQNAKTTEDLANCISDISSDTEGVYIQKIIELTSKAEPGKAQLKQLANDANTVRNIYSDCNVYAIRGSKNITELKPVIEEFAQQHGYTVESGKDDWGFDCVKVKNTAGKTIREVSADIRGNILEDEWFTYDANGNVVRNVSYDRGGEPSTIIQHYYENGVETHSTGVDKGRDIAKVYVYENGEPSVSYMHSDKVKATFGHELEGKELLDEPQQSSVPVDQATPKEATEVTDKKAYVTPEITETSAAPQEDVLASDGTSSSGLWSRFKKAIGIDSSNKSLDQVLETARKEGALVEELGNGEYRVTQRKAWKDGKTYNVGAQAKEYHTETVETYKDGNPEPVDVIRYSHDNWSNRQEAVVQRTMRDENGVTHYILDRSSGYGVEYSGYDTNGNKVPGKDQIVRVIDKDNKVLAEYTGEDIENALLVPSRNNTDSHAQPLLDVKHAISNSGISMNIVGWQATDGTGYLISSGQRFKPENFVKPVSEENIQEYTDVTLETPAFSEKSAEYNEFARTRNLTITEETSDNGKNIQFKDAKGHVVRSVTADKNGTGISTDEFFELNRDGDIVQSATRDGSGKIISRTVNEYRAFWGKACTVTLDYIKGEAHSGLWLRGNLTNQQTVNLESGIALFRDYAGR